MKQDGWFQFGNGRDYGFANQDGTLNTQGWGYDPYGRVVFYHWNGMVARGLIADGVYYYSMDLTDGHYLGQFPMGNTNGGTNSTTTVKKPSKFTGYTGRNGVNPNVTITDNGVLHVHEEKFNGRTFMDVGCSKRDWRNRDDSYVMIEPFTKEDSDMESAEGKDIDTQTGSHGKLEFDDDYVTYGGYSYPIANINETADALLAALYGVRFGANGERYLNGFKIDNSTYEGVDFIAIFNPHCYVTMDEIRAAGGYTEENVKYHFINDGIYAGYLDSSWTYMPAYLAENYESLKEMYGKDMVYYALDFMAYGHAEGKVSCEYLQLPEEAW